MIKFDNLESIHLEITNRCQASCPMCSRNYHGGVSNPLIKNQDWTVEDFKKIINLDVLSKIKQIIFCGNFGDPLLNQDFDKMCEYLTHTNLYLDIHTNGSLRSTTWWKNLPKILTSKHRVVFALDGLMDTHSIYRIGTDFNKIIENACSFINAGGNAEWCFIVFKHNQHQIDEARELSKKLGFSRFTVKKSSRFAFQNQFPVLDSKENVLYNLEPVEQEPKFDLSKVSELVAASNITCYAQQQKEVYIDAYKNLMPCCFLASLPYNYYKQNDILAQERSTAYNQYLELIAELGDTNVLRKSINEIVESTPYQTVWKKYWTIKKLYVCARTCGNKVITPSQQIMSSI